MLLERVALLAGGVALAMAFGAQGANAQGVFTISSKSFKDGERLPTKMAGNNKSNANCVGENISPELSWSHLPDGTKSLALLMFDPEGRPPGLEERRVVQVRAPIVRTDRLVPLGPPHRAPTPRDQDQGHQPDHEERTPSESRVLQPDEREHADEDPAQRVHRGDDAECASAMGPRELLDHDRDRHGPLGTQEDLGADSLDVVELVMQFEEAFDIQIPDEDAEKIKTVKDAVDYIEKNQKAAK